MTNKLQELPLGQFLMIRALRETPNFVWPSKAEYATMDQRSERVTFWRAIPEKESDLRFVRGGAVIAIKVDCVNTNWRESLTSKAEYIRAVASMEGRNNA